jgi:signal transduction histidine kinase
VVRQACGFVVGAVTAVGELVGLGVATVLLGPVMPFHRGARALFLRVVRALAGVEHARRRRFHGDPWPRAHDDGAALYYLGARISLGLLSGAVLMLLLVGLELAALLAIGAVRGEVGWAELLSQVFLGGVLLFLVVQGLLALARSDDRLVARYFGPSERELLRRRIDELAASRKGIVTAVDSERRRIERDLHDGVQQRLVALAMVLGRARRQKDGTLVEQAHRDAEEVLVELREVAWRVYPSALDTLGLQEALEGVAERSAIPVALTVRLGDTVSHPVRTAAYFVVSEAVTNAVKHSGASLVTVGVWSGDSRVRVTISDNGRGGADAAGGGLSGLGLRVAALDGTMVVTSPEGGPTEIDVELPCA